MWFVHYFSSELNILWSSKVRTTVNNIVNLIVMFEIYTNKFEYKYMKISMHSVSISESHKLKCVPWASLVSTWITYNFSCSVLFNMPGNFQQICADIFSNFLSKSWLVNRIDHRSRLDDNYTIFFLNKRRILNNYGY